MEMRMRQGFWKNKNQQRFFVHNLAKKLNIFEPKDWGKVRKEDFINEGGSSLLRFYHGSVFNCLCNVYPDIQWDVNWFERKKRSYNFWNEGTNQRAFLDNLAKILNIKSHSDWGKVSVKTIQKNGGTTLILTNKGSLLKTLQTSYPEVKWKMEWFHKRPFKYWKNKSNQRNFLEKIEQQLNIKQPADWGKVSIEQIIEMGGKGLVWNFGGSLINTLKAVYTEIDWKSEWFTYVRKYPKNFWEFKENHRKFLDEIAASNRIIHPNDWIRISSSLIKKNNGQGLLERYRGSLLTALKSVYPLQEFNFQDPKSSRIVSQSHQSLHNFVAALFPMKKICSNYRKINH